jgi:signal transduction histidine kinase
VSRLPRFRNLPLFGKLLVPLLALTVFLGAFGVFLVVRDLSARAQSALEQDLSRRSLDARSLVRDRELYLLESVNFAANLEGITEAIRARDTRGVARLLQSVLALKTDLDLVVATDAKGVGLVEFVHGEQGGGTQWGPQGLVSSALAGTKSPGILTAGGETMLAIAAPVCAQPAGCAAVGAAIAGIRASALAETARGNGTIGASIYDTDGRLLADAGTVRAAKSAPALPEGGQVRRTSRIGSQEIATLYSPLEIGGRRAGMLSVSIPTEPAFASVRGARVRLALVLLAAMVGAVALGAMTTRLILREVRPLVAMNRALGRGDLSARAPVLADDELGELARGVNQMAEQLQATYETLELRVAQRTEQVRRLLGERTEFFASISHELRTPLAIIQGKAKMMRDPTFPKSEKWTADTGRAIGETTDQLLALVNEILELARAESGRIELELEDAELADIVRELRPTVVGLAKSADLKASVDVARDLPAVRVDRKRMREIIVNLVDNAVKYTPPGGKIALSATARNGGVQISVADSGIGITPEAGDLVFEPFYRVKGAIPQRGQASSGLGLALARRLVEAQGGKIWYASEPGEGATFTFTVPAVKTP